jgi:uncharacterized protein
MPTLALIFATTWQSEPELGFKRSSVNAPGFAVQDARHPGVMIPSCCGDGIRWNNNRDSQRFAPFEGVSMPIRLVLICACLLAAMPAIAGDAPPTEESVHQLLTLTNARQMLDQLKLQFEPILASALREAQQGQTLTPERQAALDRMKARMTAVINESLSWDTLEPIYLRTYRASLTQAELDGMIRFYKSSAGQAYIKKMPLIMQNVMAEMQGMIKPMQHKLAEIQRETVQELKDLKASQGGS